MVKLNPFRVAC